MRLGEPVINQCPPPQIAPPVTPPHPPPQGASGHQSVGGGGLRVQPRVHPPPPHEFILL